MSSYLKIVVLVGCGLACLPEAGFAHRPEPGRDTTFSVYQLSGLTLETGEGLPLAFARIAVVGRRRGAFSNETGFYSLPVSPSDTLEVARIGYKTTKVSVAQIIRENQHPGRPFLYSVLFLDEEPISTNPVTIYPYRNAHELEMAFRNIPVPSTSAIEQASDNLQAPDLAAAMAGLPMDTDEELAVAQRYYLEYYASRMYRPNVAVIDSRALVNLLNYIGERNKAQQERIRSYWPE